MKITVTKNPDGVLFMTKDGHGQVFSKDVPVGKQATFGDNTVEVAKVGDEVVVRFSYVDYLDSRNRDVPGKGVRQTVERPTPGRFVYGPYVVEVAG